MASLGIGTRMTAPYNPPKGDIWVDKHRFYKYAMADWFYRLLLFDNWENVISTKLVLPLCFNYTSSALKATMLSAALSFNFLRMLCILLYCLCLLLLT